MRAIISKDIDPSNVVSIHNLASDVVYRFKEYLFCELQGGGVILIDTDPHMNNSVTVLEDVSELTHQHDITVGEPTNLKLTITVS